MPTLLHVDSSPLYGHSVSRELSAAFVEHWKAAHPGETVISRDLCATPLTPMTAAWVGAMATPEESRTPEQVAELVLSDTLLAELNQADEYVIALPVHNFNIASVLKLWIDQITRPGKTFAYVDGKPQGLLLGKKATFIVASGGVYDEGTERASLNFAEPYLRAMFGFLGVTNTRSITAGGMAALRYGADRATLLAPHLLAVQTHVQTF